MTDALLQTAFSAQQSGDLVSAEQLYQKIIALHPQDETSHCCLADVQRLLGKFDKAAHNYQRVLQINKNNAGAWTNLGAMYWSRGKLSEALACTQQVIQLCPDFSEAYNNLGCIAKNQGNLQSALVAFRQAITLRPNYHAAHSNYLFALNYLPNLSPEEIFAKHKSFSPCCHPEPKAKDLTASAVSGRSFTDVQDDKSNRGQGAARSAPTNRKIKVGYLSPDFRTHSVAYFIEPILAHHNPDQFDVFCYADVPHPDLTTQRLKGLVPHWHDTHPLSDSELFDLIRSHQLDILVDLAGHTASNRLPIFAQRAAPIQVTYLGYPNTTGLSQIDYRLTDPIADPPDQDTLYTEKLYRLPHGFLCYQPPPNAPDINPLPALHNGFITFASCNALPKINPEVISLWSQILNAVPHSRLLLKNSSFSDAATNQHYLQLFSQHGISPDRLSLLGWSKDTASHLSIYHQIDIALDTFPYNGTTTTCEALWMGVPVITLQGNRHAGRVGMSVLENANCPQGITSSLQDYCLRAVDLAQDLTKLTQLRQGLQTKLRHANILNPYSFISSIETAYREMLNMSGL